MMVMPSAAMVAIPIMAPAIVVVAVVVCPSVSIDPDRIRPSHRNDKEGAAQSDGRQQTLWFHEKPPSLFRSSVKPLA